MNLIFIIHILSCCWSWIGYKTDGSWIYTIVTQADLKGSGKPPFDI